jgi:predicted amidophosphoribosyltransferase
MPTVAELTAVYGNFMLGPRRGPGVCRTCFNLTDGYDRCYACTHIESWLDAMAPISYSVAHEQLHHALAAYKRAPIVVAGRFQVELAAVLWRHLDRHESCLAREAQTKRFDLVTTVPSSDPHRDAQHPLHRIVAELVKPTRDRYARVLTRSAIPTRPHEFNDQKFEPTTDLTDRSVLLIDDTWTMGANAQSAGAALKRNGATTVAALAIGRHVNRDWGQNDRRLRALESPFDWDRCPLCHPKTSPKEPNLGAGLATERGG